MSINLYDNPRKLYKYYPLSKEYAVKLADDEKGTDILMFTPNLSREDASSIGEVIDKWRAIALDGYIFYTSPQFFNDPFDTQLPNAPEIVPSIKKRKEIIKVLKRVISIKKDEINRLIYSENFDRALNIVIENQLPNRDLSMTLLKKIKQHKISYKEEIVISCFSEVNNSKLMWAHYADGYSGLCIEYDFAKSKDKAFLEGIAKVEYTNKKPCVEQFENEEEYVSRTILTKSECWSYEREWRSRKIGEYSMWKSKSYPIIKVKDYITAIYLGCNMPYEYQNEIIKQYKNTGVKVFKMELCEDIYDMYFEQC